jgi:hypothetical protein
LLVVYLVCNVIENNFVFQEILKEKAIAPFSKWEKEFLKIIFDP